MLKNVKTILVIKLRDIGDVVLSTPVLNILEYNCALPVIVYVVKKEYENFRYLLPHTSKVITYDKNDPFDFIRLIIKLRKYKFDLAINLHATFRSALMTLLSGAKFRLVHNHSGKNYFSSAPINVIEGPKWNTQRDLDTLNPLKLDYTEALIKTRLIINKSVNLNSDFDWAKLSIGFGIGAKRREKMWPKEKFAELGIELAKRGHNIVICCIESERKEGEYIASQIGPNARLHVGDFLQFSIIISKMKVFIGNDSALVHIAAALGTKSITLFGPENPAEWHPYKTEDGHIALSHLGELAAKGEKVLSREFREKSTKAIDLITVEEVIKTAGTLVKI